MAEKGAILF